MQNQYLLLKIKITTFLLATLLLVSLLTSLPTLAVNTPMQNAIIYTNLGDIKIELYADNAPLTVANFMRYIDAGAYTGGSFYRVVRLDNDNGAPKIKVIQGGANPDFKDFAPIPLESTEQSGIKHLDGVLSMARGGLNSATQAFFICIGDQPGLDKGAQRNPDGQGFAAFGRVISGMDVVNTILQIRDIKKVEDVYIAGQVLAKPVIISKISVVK